MKKNLRRCLQCYCVNDRRLMLRMMRHHLTGEVHIHPALAPSEGRSAWVCKHTECVNKARKTRRLEKLWGLPPQAAEQIWLKIQAQLPVSPP